LHFWKREMIPSTFSSSGFGARNRTTD
jgi:hypothetical protein